MGRRRGPSGAGMNVDNPAGPEVEMTGVDDQVNEGQAAERQDEGERTPKRKDDGKENREKAKKSKGPIRETSTTPPITNEKRSPSANERIGSD